MNIKIEPMVTIVPGTTYIPTGTVVYVGPTLPPPPSVCPGCGRCKDCGQLFAAPVAPLPYDIWSGGSVGIMPGQFQVWS